MELDHPKKVQTWKLAFNFLNWQTIGWKDNNNVRNGMSLQFKKKSRLSKTQAKKPMKTISGVKVQSTATSASFGEACRVVKAQNIHAHAHEGSDGVIRKACPKVRVKEALLTETPQCIPLFNL